MRVLRELKKPEWIIAIGTVILVVLTVALLGVTILLLPDDKLAVLRLYHWPLVALPVIVVAGMVIASVLNFKAAKTKNLLAGEPAKSAPLTPPDTSVKNSDPKIEVQFADDRGATPSKDYAYFELINRGEQSEARLACIEDFHIGGHLVRFRKFAPPIPPFGHCANVYPFDINRPDGHLSDMDIFQVFYQEWDALHRMQLREFTVPIKVTYQDAARNLFEVRCELVFYPSEHLKHPERPNGVKVIEIKNQKIRKVAAALSPVNWGSE